MYYPHPRFRRRAYWWFAIPMFGIAACQRTADQSTLPSTLPSTDTTHANASSSIGDNNVRNERDSVVFERVAAGTVDDFGNVLPTNAAFGQRVVSLNPTATEIIFAIGADSLLVGRSRWDEFPHEARLVPDVGDGIRPNIEAVLNAKPTLVILYATAENRAAAEAFTNAGIRTIALRVDHIHQFMSLTRTLGVALGATTRAEIVVDTVTATLQKVLRVTQRATPRTVAWPLWQSPVMVVGRGSYLDELLTVAGATNVFHNIDAPSPPVNVEEIAKRNPDVIVATAKSFAELRGRPAWHAVRAVRDSQFVIDQPDLTGRPSVVLGMASVMLARALHPELASELPTLPAALLLPPDRQ